VVEDVRGVQRQRARRPARMATAIIDSVNAQDPPRRLLLGTDALEIAVSAEEARIAEAQKWAEVSRSTDFTAEPRLETSRG
jgi:hypothetical protein